MRPLRLDLRGFTVFREPTTVDFTDADYFALVGPTGSGKSTVLDAICFALYGTVPRWGDRRRIENALAPSAQEARVQLVFEAAGARFVATRIVRRDSKGKVSTSHAGLEQLPPGFDLAGFDTAPAEREAGLGVVLAGTPAEMDAAVREAVGLPYEQFTSCVVLPQGEFARFLHAKPAQRQEILVNLLGLHVYQRIGERAGVVQREAEARAAASRSLLGDVTGADDASLRDAERAVAATRELVGEVEARLPALAAAAAAGESARTALARIEREISTLAAIDMPAGVTSLGQEVAKAREQAEAAVAAVHAAEEREEKLRAELAGAGDKAELTRVLDGHAERTRLAGQVGELAAGLARAKQAHAKVSAALAKAQSSAASAAAAVATAVAGVDAAQTADRAASLRPHLVAGAPCPVCEQTVVVPPPLPEAPALAAARAHQAKAERAARAAAGTVEEHDRASRELDRGLAVVTAQHEESARRLAGLDSALAVGPTLATAKAELATVAKLERALTAASDGVRAARRSARAAATRAQTADDRLKQAWRGLDQVRDALAGLRPPAPDRDDLVGSWRLTRDWAGAEVAQRTQARAAVLAEAEAALSALTARASELAELFARAGAAGPTASGDPAAHRQAAALAAQRAEAAHARVTERRQQAARLAGQVAEQEQEARVAKSLALHLRADRFERWLLAEALDALVAGASRILRELSTGQYDLAHDRGELFVVDHADAGLRRGVRTLSGGETFQASLALALALSDQLAGLSTTAASLGSILLDEGFGSLDAATLETVTATLENLAARGDRMVGVVTHVPALAERVPVRFEVSKDASGAATVVRSG